MLVHDCIMSAALARNRSPTHGMPSVHIGYLMHGTLRRQQPPGRVVGEMQSPHSLRSLGLSQMLHTPSMLLHTRTWQDRAGSA